MGNCHESFSDSVKNGLHFPLTALLWKSRTTFVFRFLSFTTTTKKEKKFLRERPFRLFKLKPFRDVNTAYRSTSHCESTVFVCLLPSVSNHWIDVHNTLLFFCRECAQLLGRAETTPTIGSDLLSVLVREK